MIKKRTRPQPRVREAESIDDTTNVDEIEGEEKASLSDLLELQKLRKSRQGIDASKLGRGDAKKKRKKPKDEDVGGLRPGAVSEDDEDEAEKDARTRKAVRVGNFTGQTNALDVDKHMMAYIEDNLKARKGANDSEQSTSSDAQQDLYNQVVDRWKDSQQKAKQDGNVTNSAKMLTAIPEVDLGIDARLKNIEDTEKARRSVGDNRPKHINPDEEHLVAQRFYRPNFRQKSDSEILRDAKLEAMGVSPREREDKAPKDRYQTATDELVMERFKKRLRK